MLSSRQRERRRFMAQPFVIDGVCHPYNFSEENLRGRFGRIFNDVLYAFHPLLNPPDTVLSKEEWQHDWQNDEFLETMFLESDRTGRRFGPKNASTGRPEA